MANRQNFPSSLFPLRGDLSAEAGDVKVTVVGLQTIPIDSTTPTGSPTLVCINGVLWTPTPINESVLADGVPISGDYAFLVNNVGLEVLVGWAFGFSSQVFLNGSAI